MNPGMTPLSSKYFAFKDMILWGRVMFHSCRGNTKVEADSSSETLAEFQPDHRSPSARHFSHPETLQPSTSTAQALLRSHQQSFLAGKWYLPVIPSPHICSSRQTRIHPRANRPITPAIMLSLVLTILFVHIAIYLVNTIGASTIDALVC